MKLALPFLVLLMLVACKSTKSPVTDSLQQSDFTIAFGSCNKSNLENSLWDDILNAKPDVWIWGGDNVYADTDNMDELRREYQAQNNVRQYKKLKKNVPIIGTWDDHDYGLNDGGVEFVAKKGSQQEFLDFMGIPKDSPKRIQEGVYSRYDYNLPFGKIKVIVLDTRYFRTALTPDTETDKRTKPNDYGQGTVLGDAQWKWLENILKTSNANYNVIVSSIQFLSNEHGFECWGNFPHEVDKLKGLIADSKAKGVIYSEFSGEPNPFRVGPVISTESFGVLQFNFLSNSVDFSMVGNDGVILAKLEQSY